MACQDTLHRIAPGSRIDTDFPPKHLFSCEGPKLEDRRHGLERPGNFVDIVSICWVGGWDTNGIELTSGISGKL